MVSARVSSAPVQRVPVRLVVALDPSWKRQLHLFPDEHGGWGNEGEVTICNILIVMI